LRDLVGAENFYAGLSESDMESVRLHIELARDPAFHIPSIREIEQADAILILGEDVTNIAPRIALALRQSVRNKAKELAQGSNIPQWQDAAVRELAQRDLSPLCILAPYASRLDDIASDCYVNSPPELASVAQALAHTIADTAPAAKVSAETADLVQQVAAQLQGAKRPLIIAGSSGGPVLQRAAANIARALHVQGNKVIDLCLLVPEVNTVGLGMLTPTGQGLAAALQRINDGATGRAIVLENDLLRGADRGVVTAALEQLKQLVGYRPCAHGHERPCGLSGSVHGVFRTRSDLRELRGQGADQLSG